jgi:hypothetical protein
VYSGFLLQKDTKTAREIFSSFEVVFCVRELFFWDMTRRKKVIGSRHSEGRYWFPVVLDLADEGNTYLRIVSISI